MLKFNISTFHMLFVVPLLLYIGYNSFSNSNMMFQLLFFVGLFVLGYHGYNALTKRKNIIPLFHIFMVAPALLFVGYFQRKIPSFGFNILIAIGLIAGIHHFPYAF